MFGTKLSEAEEKAKKEFGDKKPQNTVIQAHGLKESYTDPATGETKINDYITIQSDVPIDRYDMKKYNSGNLSGEKKEELDALARLINWTSEDCVLSSCGVGSDELFLSRIQEFYKNNVTSKTNLFINKDYTQNRWLAELCVYPRIDKCLAKSDYSMDGYLLYQMVV